MALLSSMVHCGAPRSMAVHFRRSPKSWRSYIEQTDDYLVISGDYYDYYYQATFHEPEEYEYNYNSRVSAEKKEQKTRRGYG